MANKQIIQELHVNDIINFIILHHPNIITTILSQGDLKVIDFYIQINGFRTIMALYGYKFLLGALKYFEHVEHLKHVKSSRIR
jgi:hypothetical protein